jgi:hypothetical protein
VPAGHPKVAEPRALSQPNQSSVPKAFQEFDEAGPNRPVLIVVSEILLNPNVLPLN